MRRTLSLCFIAPLACTVGDDDSDPFGSGTVPGPTTTITTTTTTAATGESSGTGSTGDDGDDTTTAGLTTSTTTAESTGPDPAGSSDGGVSTDGGEGGNGMQPQDGMYSHCLTADECGFNPILCITIGADPDNPTDGFCSETGCANPAVDCAASPGGTATPICMPVNVDGMDLQACALSCAGGLVCPQPMMCYNLTDIGMICG